MRFGAYDNDPSGVIIFSDDYKFHVSSTNGLVYTVLARQACAEPSPNVHLLSLLRNATEGVLGGEFEVEKPIGVLITCIKFPESTPDQCKVVSYKEKETCTRRNL